MIERKTLKFGDIIVKDDRNDLFDVFLLYGVGVGKIMKFVIYPGEWDFLYD